MSTAFDLILEDFQADLQAISDSVHLVEKGGGSARARVASINSGTLMLAATFEEVVRELGREFVRQLVLRASSVADLPIKLTATAWKRTLEELARAKIDTGGTNKPLSQIAAESRTQFDSVCRFIEGDLTQNIYKNIAHNESNMRPQQINSIFKIFGITDICSKISGSDVLKKFYDEADEGQIHKKLTTGLNDFIEKRNNITHSLNPSTSVTAEEFVKDLKLLSIIAEAIKTHLSSCIAAPARV